MDDRTVIGGVFDLREDKLEHVLRICQGPGDVIVEAHRIEEPPD